MPDIPAELIAVLKTARHVAVLTGAGISQESGLRTFRDAQSGLWAQYRPEDLATAQAFERDAQLVWDWYAMRRAQVHEVSPNPGHYALVEMAAKFAHFTLITQNVDGLHQKAGSADVIELHGNLMQVRCSSCAQLAVTWDEGAAGVPHCPACGGLLRPNVVWFGESLPGAALERAIDAANCSDVFFSIGTSGLVQPAASLALAAKNRQACVIQINAEATTLTSSADYFLAGSSGQILPELVRRL